MRRKGCPNACTAHKLLYYSSKNEEGKFSFRPRKKLEKPNLRLVIVDEISMLPKSMWELLLSHHVHVIGCGDPAQIPPISKNDTHSLLEEPHIFLDEIVRQAEDNEIIDLSMKVRHNKQIRCYKGKDVQVVRRNALVTGMLTWADQIITATNKTRVMINKEVRRMKNKSGPPQIGDKIISLENHWDILDTKGASALVNGTIGYIKKIEISKVSYCITPGFVIGPIEVYKITLENEVGEVFANINIDKNYIDTGVKSLSPRQEYLIYGAKKRLNIEEVPALFDYGYAITNHRAQGSSWEKVLVIEENFPFNGDEHRQWLYSAITRPEQKCVLVKKD